VTNHAAMTSLKALFVKEDRFLSLLEASAREGCASAQALRQIINNSGDREPLKKVLESRQKERQIASEIEQLLCESFTTPLEREDIETLGRALDRITKSIKKFAERYLISARQLKGIDFSEQIKMLESATETVQIMVAELKRGPHLSATKAHNDTLQKLEGQADDMLTVLLEGLYHWPGDPLQAVILKDLYELMERIFDRCRTAGNIVLQIVLKHS
jgi:uncharacterized protein